MARVVAHHAGILLHLRVGLRAAGAVAAEHAGPLDDLLFVLAAVAALGAALGAAFGAALRTGLLAGVAAATLLAVDALALTLLTGAL